MNKFVYLLVFFFLLECKLHSSPALLVTGCGRSGTNYLALVLKQAGHEIFHERLGKDGIVSWTMTVDSISPWGPFTEESFQHVFHQVKHPLPVLTSWISNLYDLERDEWVFIRQHIPEIKLDDSLIVHCAKYWYYWNLLAEKKTEWRFRIEDIRKILPELINRSGLVLDNEALEKALNEVPSNYNSWYDTSKKITWKELKQDLPRNLYKKIQKMTLRYGYTIYE